MKGLVKHITYAIIASYPTKVTDSLSYHVFFNLIPNGASIPAIIRLLTQTDAYTQLRFTSLSLRFMQFSTIYRQPRLPLLSGHL